MAELADLFAAPLFALLDGLLGLLLDFVVDVLLELRDGFFLVFAELVDHPDPAFVVLLDLVAQLLDGLGVKLLLLLQLDVDLRLLLRVVFGELVQLENAVVELYPQPLELLVMLAALVLLVEVGACRGQHFHLLIVILYNYYRIGRAPSK